MRRLNLLVFLILVLGPVLGEAQTTDVLLIDDVLDRVKPRDSERDQFWADRFAAYGITPAIFNVWGDDDRTSVPRVPTASDLMDHDIIVWNVDAGGYSGTSALLETIESGVLAAYLQGGGRLWVLGRMNASAMVPPGEDGVTGDFTYPKETEPGTFLWDFMKLRGVTLDNDKAADNTHRLAGVSPDSGAVENEFLSLSVDTGKLNAFEAQLGGITFCDAITVPHPFERPDSLDGEFQVLYRYDAVDPESRYYRRACATRWRDPVAEPEHGRVMWFGFQLYYMDDTEAQDAFDKALDWLRGLNDPSVPVRLLYLDVARAGSEARLRWGVAEAFDHAGFHVYRGPTAASRQQLTPALLSGRDRYEFVDIRPPADGARYWLSERSRDGRRSWHGPVELAPALIPGVVLSHARPNPFVDEARVSYGLPRAGSVRISVYDVAGRRVFTQDEGWMPAGTHTAAWDGRADAGHPARAGFYFLTLESGGERRTTKVLYRPR